MEILESEPHPKIIYVTDEEHRSEWTYDATKELLKIYDEKTDMLETGIITTQKKLWELTSRALAKKGYYYTGAQCENKWKALKRSYRTKLDRMQKFGSSKRPCPFEYEVAEILSKRPNDSITRSYSSKIDELKKEEDLFKVNLNEPPGFTKEEEEDSFFKQEEEENDAKSLLNENYDDQDYSEQQHFENEQPTYTIVQEQNQTMLTEELSDLKRIINRHNKVNTMIFKQATETQRKILSTLERTVEGQDKALAVEVKKVQQQSAIVAQMKVQNELLQKLLDKFS